MNTHTPHTHTHTPTYPHTPHPHTHTPHPHTHTHTYPHTHHTHTPTHTTHTHTHTYIYIYIHTLFCIIVRVCVYTGCPRRKGPNFGKVFLRSNYTDITQNTYIQISMVTEILAREKCGRLWCLRTVVCPWRHASHMHLTFYAPTLQ